MKDSGLTKDKVDEVLLVGGSTRMPKVGDICLMARQKGKLSQVLEYARVLAVEDDGRELKLRVCRSKSGNVKEINGSSRNAHLVFRPDTDK